jgi:capsular polysaccharide biosynthesis protein
MIQSEFVLGKVSEELDLNTVWGKRYANGEKLRPADTVAILKARMRLQLVNNTTITEIRVLTEDRDEAATVANKIAQVFADYARSTASGLQVEIVDIARPSARPFGLIKPAKIVLGMIVGALLGALAGGAGAALAGSWRRKGKQPPTIP